MKITLKELTVTLNYQSAWGHPEHNRDDINPKKLYLVEYSGTWLIGRFQLLTYDPTRPRWIFNPNIGAMSPPIDSLTRIVEIVDGLEQVKDGSTAAHILGYLAEMQEEEDE